MDFYENRDKPKPTNFTNTTYKRNDHSKPKGVLQTGRKTELYTHGYREYLRAEFGVEISSDEGNVDHDNDEEYGKEENAARNHREK